MADATPPMRKKNADQLRAWYHPLEKSRRQKRINPEIFFAHRERNSPKIQSQSARELRHLRTRRKIASRPMHDGQRLIVEW